MKKHGCIDVFPLNQLVKGVTSITYVHLMDGFLVIIGAHCNECPRISVFTLFFIFSTVERFFVILQNIFVLCSYLNNGSRVPENDANLRIEQLLKFHEAAVKLAKEKRERDGIDIDMATSLRWAGFTPKDSLDHALIFNYYQFENGLLPLAVSTIPCGMSGKSGRYLYDLVTYYLLSFIRFHGK